MERLPARLSDTALLGISGEILSAHSTQESIAALRQRLYMVDFSWANLIAFAIEQDILPPLIRALQSLRLLLPAPKALSPEQRKHFITSRLNEAYAEHAARQSDLQDQLLNCIAALNRSGITPVILKGARYLIENSSHWGSARPMRDIDLLVRQDEADAAIRALTKIGYVADKATGLQHQHFPELRLAGRHGVIELHTEALAPAGAKFMPTVLVWKKAVPIEVSSLSALILPAAWQALHALLHHQASDDGYNQNSLALKPLWEFSCLASALAQTEWNDLIAQMAQSNGVDLLASWCLQAKQIFGLPPPEALGISAKARVQVATCFREAAQPEPWRRFRFVLRQLRHGFSGEMLAMRYGKSVDKVGFSLRARHVWFLLRRYRGALWSRLFHP